MEEYSSSCCVVILLEVIGFSMSAVFEHDTVENLCEGVFMAPFFFYYYYLNNKLKCYFSFCSYTFFDFAKTCSITVWVFFPPPSFCLPFFFTAELESELFHWSSVLIHVF